MIFFNLLFILFIPVVLGLLIFSALIQKKSAQYNIAEKIALAFPIGLGIIVITMYLFGIFKIPITLINILIPLFISSVILILYLIEKKTFCINPNELIFKIPKFDWLEYVFLTLISLKVLYVFFEALIKPLADIDAFQFYSIVAKGVFYTKTFLTPYLSQFIGDKPLLSFLSQGWVFLGLQTINDSLIKIISPILFLCLLITFFSILNRYYSQKFVLFFTFLLASMPFLAFHAKTAYADFTMTFYYATATIYLFIFMKGFSKNRQTSHSNLFISFILLGLSIWVKRAGIVLAGCNILALVGFIAANRKKIGREEMTKIIASFIIFFLIISPWLIYGQKDTLVRITTSITSTQTEQPDISIMLAIFFKKLFLYADWHLLWALFLVVLTLNYKNSFKSPNIFLLLIILMDISVIFGQFYSGEMYKWLLDGTLFDRLIMNQAPIVLYFCAEVIGPLAWKDNSSES